MAEQLSARNPGRRADSRATRERILTALGRLLDHGHGDATLQTVAEEAGVSTATAYRYFGSTEEAVVAYTTQFADAVAAAVGEREDGEKGLARLALWSSTWIQLIDEGWGNSLVQLRSPEGFLARRARREPVIQSVCVHLEPMMEEALVDLEAAPASLDVALFLWNAIYDPREILDLRRTLRWTRGRIEANLMQMFTSALRDYEP